MLTTCPECELQVSTRAVTCPHCGYPLTVVVKRPQTKSKKHLRLPNGFGEITKIKNRNLRNPFRASVCVGKTEFGKPIVKILKPKGYFKTYNEAYNALMEYNKNPYSLDDLITVEELYARWTEEYFATFKSESSKRTITSAWMYCSELYKVPAKEIRARHIKSVMEHGQRNINGKIHMATQNTKSRIKSIFNLMLDYAVEYELVDKNYARTFNLTREETYEDNPEENASHRSFTEEELKTLWNNLGIVKNVNIILYQCYSGWRPQELGLLKISDVNLEDMVIRGGMKTKAGRGRLVPIHPKVKNIVLDLMEDAKSIGSEYLINAHDTRAKNDYFMSYDKYSKRFATVITALKLDPTHKAHDSRKTFVTRAKKYKMDEYALKRMLGHRITDLTEAVYTERPVSWLVEEMNKIID